MATVISSIEPELARWLEAQPVFFVATAPLAQDGLINCSPKGTTGTFRVLDDHRVAYLDLTGSGIETVAHLRENGRIVVMFCAFDGRPRIIRLHGSGSVRRPSDAGFAGLVERFSSHPGVRSVVVVDVSRIAESCGFAVPKMTYDHDRDTLDATWRSRGEEAVSSYHVERNAHSLDGLPGLRGLPGLPGLQG